MSANGAPVLLAIEMSQRTGSLALHDGQRIHSCSFPCGAREADQLLPQAELLLREAQRTPQDFDGVVVSQGPGGFTGLRIALATAKGISESTGCAVIAVPSAEVVVASTLGERVDGTKALVIAAVKASDGWVTGLQLNNGVWSSEFEGLRDLDPVDAEVLEFAANAVVIGDEFVPPSFAAAVGGTTTPVLSATELLEIGSRKFALGETIDPLLLTPLYPREPEAVRKWRQLHG